MPNEKLAYYIRMAEETAQKITWNMDTWTAFLRTASRLYKYPFQEQLLIFAQRPGATACADYATWNNRMRRYVKRGGNGIALIDESGGRPRLKYVFDVTDTGGGPEALSPYVWTYRPDDHFRSITDALAQRYGLVADDDPEAFPVYLKDIFLILATDFWENNSLDILRSVDNSLLAGYDESEIRNAFLQAAAESGAYLASLRLSLRQGSQFNPTVFHRIAEFNTPDSIGELGRAINESGAQVLRTIETTIKAYERERLRGAERSRENEPGEQTAVRSGVLRRPDRQDGSHGQPGERSELSPGGRGLDSGYRSGTGADGGRPAHLPLGRPEAGLPEGASSELVSAARSSRDSVDAHEGRTGAGAEDAGYHAPGDGPEGGRDGRAAQDGPAALGRVDEQPEGQRGRSDLQGADLRLTDAAPPQMSGTQLSFFPSEAEQLQIIHEAESAQAAPFASSVSQEVIDAFLQHGSNDAKTRMRVIAALAAYGDLSAAGFDLKEHYRGGYGIEVDGIKYAAWYDDAGIRISRGSSAQFAPFAETVPWYDAGQRIAALYRSGAFALNMEAVEAIENERRELATTLLYIYHDLTEEATPHYLLSLAPYAAVKGGYPEQEAALAEALSVPEKVKAVTDDLYKLQNDMVRYYTETQDKFAFQRFLRFRHHGMKTLGPRLAALALPQTLIPQAAAELPHTPFITEDEIDATLINRGSGVSGGKARIYNYFTARPSHTPKEKAESLKNEFGIGGYSHGVSGDGWVDHDAKGLRLRKGLCPAVTISWPNVAKRIDTLIRTGRYLTPKEQVEKATAPAVQKPNEKESLSAAYAAYQRIKTSDTFIADGLLLYRMGEFYELFGDDAEITAKSLDFTTVTWNSPEGSPISMVGVPRHNLEHYLERLRDSYDVTVVAGDDVKRYPSMDHEAKEAINEHEAEFGADGWRAFGGRPAYEELATEPAPAQTTPEGPPTEPNYDAEAALDEFMSYLDGEQEELHDTPAPPSDADPRSMDNDPHPNSASAEEIVSRHDTSRQPEASPVREMTQDEIDAALQSWNGRIESKRTVVRYMEAHGRERQTAEWLKKEFKSENPDLYDRVRLENGLTLINPDGSAEIVLPWQKVQRRIAQLIREDRFFTEQELDNFEDIDVAAVREQLAQKPEAGDGDRLAEMLRQAELASELYEQTGQPVFVFEEGNAQPVNLTEKTGANAPKPERISEPEDMDSSPDSHSAEPNYTPYKKDDTVYLENTEYRITAVNDYDVQLQDPTQRYPIFRSENRQHFERMLLEDRRNLRITEFLAGDLDHCSGYLRDALTWDGGLLDLKDKEQIATLFRYGAANSRISSFLAASFMGQEIEMLMPSGDQATLTMDVHALDLRVENDEGIAISVSRTSWAEIAPLLRAMYQQDRYGFFREPELPEPVPNVPTGGDQTSAHGQAPATEQPNYTVETVAEYPAIENGLPYDVSVQVLRTEPKEPIIVPPENFRIIDDHLGEGGPKAKFRANMDAIAVLKSIEAEGRSATQEEQETLSRYVGWGGLADAFDAEKTDWAKEYAELKAALTPEEYVAARSSTLNAHYTSPTVIRSIFAVLGNMGFTSGNILEPACGIGNFFGCLPQEMSASKLYGVELDSVSGRIAKQLYPQASITVAGFETTDRRGFYDVAIGNVPFGQYQVNDRAYNKLGFSIHNYFFAKALDQIRPGGVVAFVTSRYTLDAKDSTVRRYLAQRADFLGAIRLPNNAFRANAGTDVVSDIIFLQKREKPSLEEPDWLFTAKNIPDNTPAKVGDTITFTTGYPPKEYTAEVVEIGQGYAGVPYYRAKNDEREFSYIAPGNVIRVDRREFVYEINQYFLDHPEMVLGEATSESTQYGRQGYTVKPLDGADLAVQLHEAVGHIRAVYRPAAQVELNTEEVPAETMPADPSVRNYSYTLIDGALWFRENSIMRKSAGLPAATEARIKGMVELRDCLRSLLELEMNDYATDEAIAEKQKELSERYDAFVAKHGQVNDRANELAFAEDTSYFLLCSLEEPEKDGKSYRKATDIFTKRTIKQQRSIDHVDTAAEALAVSIGQRAAVDLPFMAQLMGGEEFIPQIVEDLHGVIFKTPESGPFDYADGGDHWDKGWQPADEYLSGNVRRKLRQAQTADKDNPFFEINVEALKRAQPRDLEASEIEVRLGSTWISPQIFEQFMIETFKTPRYHQGLIRVRYSPHTAEWFIENKSSVGYGDMTATNTYGTSRANAYEILEDSLNLRDVRVYDKVEEDGKEKRVLNVKETTLAAQKQQAIRDAFKDWLWKDQDRRDKLVKQYNEEMNSTRPREYDGQHLVFSGINPDIVLRDHQLNAIAHVIYGGNTMLAHEVGAGKTFEMVAAAMESKRLGLCSKSLFVVPNHLVSQWASEFLRLYPAANILVTTKRDFEPARRKKFCSRIATGDYDAVIIGQSQFEKIPISDERQRAFLVRQIEDITEALQETKSERGDRFSIKQLEKTKKSLEAKLEKLQGSEKKDNVVTFEELGVDRLFIDESDNYKNLFLYTKMRNVAGLSTSDAQKSSDLFNKCRYLDELTGNRGVIFATGTPISNSMTEMYTIHRYLQYDRLQEMGMGHFDCWASRFGETTTSLELAPEGTGYRARTRFAKFFNLPELMTFFREVADIKTADQLNLPTPEVEYHNIVAKPTEIQKKFVKTLSERASRVHSGIVDPKEDNMLKITSDGRKLGLDQRLIDPLLPDEPGTKVNLCVENILHYWREGEADKLTQLVFCDVSTPIGRSSHKDALPEEEPAFTNIYEDIRRKLIRGGMPAEQIAFIHDADNEKRKEELFSKMRSGEVRVLIGSTAKMGAGTNVQDKLIASHDLDCPWRPRDLTQRKGRIERQGNTNSKVHVCRYVTEGTFDAYLWQTIESKQKFISQIMTSKSPVRSCDDVDETVLSFAEIKALCAGDPRIKERMDLDVEVKKLRLMKADHNSKKYRIQDMLLRYYPSMVEAAEADIRGLTHDMQTLAANPLPEEGFVGMVVRGDKLSDKKNAGAALISACQEMVSKEAVKIGSYRGFDILASYDTWERQYKLTLKGRAAHNLTLGSDPVGNLVRMENALSRMPARLETAKAELENYRKQQAAAALEVNAEFPQEAELAEKSARLIELDTLLNLDGGPKTQELQKQKKKHEEVR